MIISGDEARRYIREHCTHFSPQELECRCGCGGISIDIKLIDALNHLRIRFGRPVVINSGYRCLNHNRAINGAKSSPHMIGCAVDVKAITSATRYKMLDVLFAYGIRRIGLGSTFIHFDTAQGEPYAQDVVWHYYPKGGTA